MDRILTELTSEMMAAFKRDMKAAFRYGALMAAGIDEEVLPEHDIDESLNTAGAVAYMAILDGEMVGGAILVIDSKASRGRLDFLYVKVGYQGRSVGQFIWTEVERKHPEIRLWETCAPYFDKRNIHFYINRCGFHAVEFYCKYHPDPHFPPEEDDGFEGMFRFVKCTDPLHNIRKAP